MNSGSATRGAAVGILEIDDDACRQFEQLLRLSMWCLLLRSDHGWVWELEHDLLGKHKPSRRLVNAPRLTRPGGVSRLDCVGGGGQQLATRSLDDASDDAEAVLFPSTALPRGGGAAKAEAEVEARSAEELLAEDTARRERFRGHRLRTILARRLHLGTLRKRITSLWEAILPLWVDCMAHPASSEADKAPTIAALRLPASRKAAKNLVAFIAEVPTEQRDAAMNDADVHADPSESSDVTASTAALFAELEYLALCAIASACPQSWFALLGIDASLNPELQDATPPSALIASRPPLAAVPIPKWAENDGVERFVLTRAHVQGAAIPPLGHGHGLSTRSVAWINGELRRTLLGSTSKRTQEDDEAEEDLPPQWATIDRESRFVHQRGTFNGKAIRTEVLLASGKQDAQAWAQRAHRHFGGNESGNSNRLVALPRVPTLHRAMDSDGYAEIEIAQALVKAASAGKLGAAKRLWRRLASCAAGGATLVPGSTPEKDALRALLPRQRTERYSWRIESYRDLPDETKVASFSPEFTLCCETWKLKVRRALRALTLSCARLSSLSSLFRRCCSLPPLTAHMCFPVFPPPASALRHRCAAPLALAISLDLPSCCARRVRR